MPPKSGNPKPAVQQQLAEQQLAAVGGGALQPQKKREPHFYLDTLYDWVQHSEVSKTYGASMMHFFHMELDCIMRNEATETPEYKEAVEDTYKTIMDGLMSAVHRRVPFYHVNRSSVPQGYHVITDEEEVEIRAMLDDRLEDEEDEEDFEDDFLASPKQPAAKATANTQATGTQANTQTQQAQQNKPAASPSTPVDAKAKKREDARKRRLEDEKLLVHDKQVRDDKGNILSTMGPHPAPKLSYKAAKAGYTFPSRRTLTQRLNVDQVLQDEDDDFDFAPSTKGPSPGVDAVDHLLAYLKPLSIDSLKKIGESAKVKITNNAEPHEAVDEIVRAAVRVGCEKACALMDKYKIIDAVTDHAHAKHSSVSAMGPIGASVEFLKSLPDDLKDALGPVLGMPKNQNNVSEMWERIVAMGFLKVLANIRQRPLRKIVSELTLDVRESVSTEKTCEAIVFTAFPSEQLRMRNAKIHQQGVMFSVLQSRSRTLGDMGFVTFSLQNVSCMQRDLERHYSPEFEFGGLKWSLLCMANKESLALYLCQTGTVHCKFIISVINNKNNEESITNEGTQKFSSSSAENDWGFNNVVKFDALLDPDNHFWVPENDSICIECGIVFVESPQQGKKAAAQQAAAKGQQGKDAKTKQADVKPVMTAKEKKAAEAKAAKEREEEYRRQQEALLETERLEALRKKLKNDIQKVQKEEEKLRKDIQQRGIKSMQTQFENFNNEKQKIAKQQRDRERREQQERQREQDRIQKAQEQNSEMKVKIERLETEDVELDEKEAAVTSSIEETKASIDEAEAELAEAEAEIAALVSKVKDQSKTIAQKKKELGQAKKELRESPKPTEEEEEAVTPANVDESELMKALRQSLAGIIGQ